MWCNFQARRQKTSPLDLLGFAGAPPPQGGADGPSPTAMSPLAPLLEEPKTAPLPAPTRPTSAGQRLSTSSHRSSTSETSTHNGAASTDPGHSAPPKAPPRRHSARTSISNGTDSFTPRWVMVAGHVSYSPSFHFIVWSLSSELQVYFIYFFILNVEFNFLFLLLLFCCSLLIIVLYFLLYHPSVFISGTLYCILVLILSVMWM